MKRKLFLLLCTLLGLLSSVQGVKAYTVSDLTSAGWTQVTDLASLTLADNYFMFVDGQEGKYSMVNAMPKGILNSVARPMYQEIADPTSDFCQVWSIENYDAENYAIKNNSDDYYLNSNGDWWSSHVSEAYGETSRMKIISIGEGKYRLQTTGTSTFWGPYNDNPTVSLGYRDGMDFVDGYASDTHYAAIAANKVESNAPGFYIYSIARTAFNAVCRRASTLVSEGWTKVTETEGLGRSGYYYVFLDASENGGESGFAMTGTGGRPQYKLGKNPIEDQTQLWTTEAHGSGYAIKNVEDGKYIYCAANWDMQATDNINTNNTDFIPAVTDGVWTLSNSISTGEFVGNYKNSPYNPTDGEELAANKASKKGKRTFLIYSIPTIAGVATELPESGSMAAGQWYHFTTTTAGDYGFSAVDGVILTTNGNQLVNKATGDALTHTVALTTGITYYIKSETAQTVTKSGPYSYTIGTAASDKEYVQPGNTVTVSYASMATTNTYASEISTAITGVTLGGEPISVTRTTKGFTFTVPEVTKGADYTLSIPADIIGYDAPGSGKNAAQEIILKVPVATEGTYYLSTVVAGQRKWLNKNGSGYTYAYDQGLPFTLERNEGSVDTYKLKFSEGNYLNDVGSNWQTKIEGSKNNDWKLQAEDGGYKLLLGVNNACQLFIKDTGTGLIEITHSTNDGNVWEFLDPETALNYAIEKAEEHVLGFEAGEYAPYNNTAALMALATAKAATTTDAQISAYAALTGATWTANAEEVNAIYDGDFAIQDVPQSNTRPIGWHRTSTAASTTGDDTGYETRLRSLPDGATSTNKGMMTKFHAFYGEDGVYTLPLKANTIYELSFKYAGYGDCNNRAAHVNVYDPSNTSITTFIDSKDFTAKDVAGDTSADSYETFTCHFTTGEAGNYVLGLIKNGGNSNQNQFAFGDIVLKKASVTYLKETVLSPEISKANDIYNSGDNVGEGVFQIPVAAGTTFYEAISDAQAVYGRGSATAEEVLASVDDLKDAEEAYANATLNAPDADKAYYIIHAVDGLAADLGTPKLNDDASVAYPVYFVSVEGNSYKISKDKVNYVAYKGGDNWSLNTTTTIANAAVCTFAYIGDGKYSITSAKGSFGTDATTAGSSIYGNKSTSAANSAWYIYDASANMAVNPTAQWGTFCASFDVAIPDDVTAYTCESASDGGSLNLTEVTGTIPANTPVILNAESGLASTIFYGKKVANESDDIIDDGGLLRGNVSSSTKDVPNDGSAYLMQLHGDKVGFYRVNGTGYLIGSNRCYLVSGSSVGAREVFFFEDDATAISALEAAKAESGALKDGKYLIEGKIVIVKNGVKYDANGKKLK